MGILFGVSCLLLVLLFVSILFRTRQKKLDQEFKREAEERLKRAMLARLRNNQS